MPRTKQAKIKVADERVMGPEPAFSGQIDREDLLRALNWYNYYFSIKDSRKWILEYMKSQKYAAHEIKAYSESTSSKITQTWASIARLLLRGAVFENRLDAHINDVITSYHPVQEKASLTVSKPSENGLIADIDDLLDGFYRSAYKTAVVPTDIVLSTYGSVAIKGALTHVQELLAEIQSIPTNKEVAEGYRLTKRQLSAYIKTLESILAHLQGAVIKKTRVMRKPRRKKVKTVDQQLKSFKYAASSAEVDVVSVAPEKIIGASVLWAYNTKYRKLMMFVANDGGFTIKGTTLQNVNTDASVAKRLRNPVEVLKSILSGGKAKIAKDMKALRTKEIVAKPRINEHTLLVRVIK